MYVYVCIQMRCFINPGERRREGREGEGGREEEREREGGRGGREGGREGGRRSCILHYLHMTRL